MAKLSSPRKNVKKTVQEITDRAAVHYLTSLENLRYLEPFMGAPHTVKDAATLLKLKPNSLLYRVKRLVELGLLEVVETRQRKGRGVKIYRSSADEYFVPYAATNAKTPEEWLLRWEQGFREQLIKVSTRTITETPQPWGLKISKDGSGLLNVVPVTKSGKSLVSSFELDKAAMLTGWSTGLYMDFPVAKAFQRELHELIVRYFKQGGAQQYMIRVALVPLPEQRLPSVFSS
jgi:hypothetical protein